MSPSLDPHFLQAATGNRLDEFFQMPGSMSLKSSPEGIWYLMNEEMPGGHVIKVIELYKTNNSVSPMPLGSRFQLVLEPATLGSEELVISYLSEKEGSITAPCDTGELEEVGKFSQFKPSHPENSLLRMLDFAILLPGSSLDAAIYAAHMEGHRTECHAAGSGLSRLMCPSTQLGGSPWGVARSSPSPLP